METTDDVLRDPRGRRGAAAAIAVIAWIGLWFLTPGLTGHGLGSLVSRDEDTALIIETLVALGILLLVMLLLRGETAMLLAPSRALWAYALPVVAGVLLPLHYGIDLPLGIYMLWMAVSVLWQDILTFGLLQDRLERCLGARAAVAATAVVFWTGHALVLPERFSPAHPVASLAIVAMGVVFAGLRRWTGTVHLLIALHLAFYYIGA